MSPYKKGRGVVARKVKAAGAGGALATVLVWTAAQFGVVMPPGVGEAFAVLLAVAAGYVLPEEA